MSKLNQIQDELRQLDGAKFQKLCDAYLHRRGYDTINPLGSMIAKDKVVKGTPDTYISLPNGKYIFAEFTTETNGVFQKFQGDLTKVFNPQKTGMPIEKIQEIILCHASVLEPSEEEALKKECHSHGCLCSIFGIGPISLDLYQKYPGLAHDFLGVEVDTGQIVSAPEFISAYNKHAWATPLDTVFCYREQEVSQMMQALESQDLVIVNGKAGVGKTRLALECCDRFTLLHPEFQVRCIYHRGVDLFADTRVHFSPPGYYLIFVDDANRASHFEYVLQQLHTQGDDRTIKVIATVRDYAVDKVRQVSQPYEKKIEIEINPLTDQQIRDLVASQFSITNPIYLERIAEIAKGNPRLAMMAARVAVEENNLESIYNVSALYDEYFRSIRQDLEGLKDKNVLKVAGIISFFRAVDRTNSAMMQAISTAFGVSSDDFWTAAQRLHEFEAVDMYENDVVKISDQVLATYFFYLAVFKEEVLNFGSLLEHFFPALTAKFVDALNPVLRMTVL